MPHIRPGAHRHQPVKKQRGFSLVELMVGVAVGLLASLAIMQVFTVSERQKRSTSGGADALSQGTIALYSLERQARQAGWGFNDIHAMACGSVLAYNQNRAPNEFSFPAMAPVIINPTGIPAGDPDTDVLMITYGNDESLPMGVSFTQQSTSSAAYKVSNDLHNYFDDGDLLLIYRDCTKASGGTCDCEIAQVTNPHSGSGQSDVVNHNAGNDGPWNKPSGLDTGTPNNYCNNTPGRICNIYNLGQLPNSYIYAIRNGNLTRCDYLNQDCTDVGKAGNEAVWVPIASNIVRLSAQYGQDSGNPLDGVVDTWDQVTPAAGSPGCMFQRIQALRIGILARSATPERAPVTATAPSWAGGNFAMTSLGPDWKQYRYRVFQTIAPLRNIIWMPPPVGACP